MLLFRLVISNARSATVQTVKDIAGLAAALPRVAGTTLRGMARIFGTLHRNSPSERERRIENMYRWLSTDTLVQGAWANVFFGVSGAVLLLCMVGALGWVTKMAVVAGEWSSALMCVILCAGSAHSGIAFLAWIWDDLVDMNEALRRGLHPKDDA